MNLNNFTIKAQEAVQQAVQLVTKNNQQVIEPVHLLKAVIMTGESVTNFIFQKLGVNAQNLNMVLDRQIESYPKVSGGEPYLSSESNAVLLHIEIFCPLVFHPAQQKAVVEEIVCGFFQHFIRFGHRFRPPCGVSIQILQSGSRPAPPTRP